MKFLPLPAWVYLAIVTKQMRVLILIASFAAVAAAQAPAASTIRKEQLKADLFFLASDALQGRLTGTREYAISAEWVASRFERMGLKPVTGSSFRLPFTLYISRLENGNALTVPVAGGGARSGRVGEDYYPLIFSANADASGPVVFAGYGIVAPEHQWNDYRDVDAKGRIVLALTGEPGADDPKSPFDGLVTSEHSNLLRKALHAQEQGAAGILFVTGRDPKRAAARFAAGARGYWPETPPRIERYTLATMADRLHIPAAEISPGLANLLLGGDLAGAAEAAERGEGQRLTQGQPVALKARVRRIPYEDHNVAGMIEGADPKLKDEAVLITSHYDHNGAEGSQIFNGADDNGSATVGVIAIAEAYIEAARSGKRPKRTVIFTSWGSEERCCGPLLGSWAWTETPAWPLEKTAAVLNMDMIGRREEVPVNAGSRFNGLQPQTAESNANSVNLIGSSYSPALAAAAREANKDIDLLLRFRYDNNRSNLLRRSDQWPFLQRGVPALFVHTGLHPDYHTVNDRPERIDYDKMERILKMVYQLSWNLANQDGRPAMASPRVIPDPD
ncbi:MAG: M28 family peptidase [Bryobacterales bacterium]|nr:M28 family peptidase [Bryobacterales bacterium]